MTIDTIEMPELRVAAVRHVGPYSEIAKAFEQLGALAGPAGLFGSPDTLMLAIYYDNPQTTAPDRLRADAGLTLAPSASLPHGLSEQRLPAGRYARVTHVGPYEQLGQTWVRFLSDAPAAGHRLDTAPTYEIYRNTPMTTPADELITELYARLAD